MPEHIKDIKITKDSLKEEESSLDILFKQFEAGVITKQEYYRRMAQYRL